ncbi:MULTISPECIES: RNA-binding S4 domain-containing protein [unclassified Shewanella]|uniref:RNA-binding S4 domain-containing protein n=1 Tax=unclassified Shewanella TaxID=196818 RepID=UPI000C862574|nr:MULTISPECIES: RNA-binding S4 domain-containing protein [unclassified Shewanella]MDO6619481.1 RNA-binding S4 domain-containing protein [Shewanella sp. 6_MG-2023]MDO6639435.1 RNA-binding S4 domain-containing protein [Shewanella sp. 5_MG-2023]MDO6678198.1 RNA-binding S4 domain-containing protein [Shewanella sp. 4_MG-2023]MDO6775935.1 RNA-binding S4 domain-containing protein [Shewanella sp. 3_MG-2023]PMG30282.1 RNA-binding protein [Shewanella sp. 10N.286.52.C2]
MSSQVAQFALLSGDEFVELYKVLKVQGLVDGGGAAKHVISEGLVTVNNEVDTRKRKKCVVGDVIEFNGDKIQIVATA